MLKNFTVKNDILSDEKTILWPSLVSILSGCLLRTIADFVSEHIYCAAIIQMPHSLSISAYVWLCKCMLVADCMGVK